MENRELLALTRNLILEEEVKRREDPVNRLTLVSLLYWVHEAAHTHGIEDRAATATLTRLRHLTLERNTNTHDVFSTADALGLLAFAENDI